VGSSQCPAGHTAAWGLAFVEVGQHPPLSYARACAVVLCPQGGARGAPGGRACHLRLLTADKVREYCNDKPQATHGHVQLQ